MEESDGPARTSQGREAGAPYLPRRSHSEFRTAVTWFVSLLAVLGVTNRHLFRAPIHEDGDFAADSILIESAKHFEQLVGNYSRLGFSHPGPAMLYVQALGEVALYDGLGIVPAPFNGHVVAVLALNASLVALALTVLRSHTRSRLSALVAFGLVVSFASAHPPLLTSTWMSFANFAPFLLLMVAAASVASGDTRHLWLLALAGGFLAHGHVGFGLFVPVTVLAAVTGCAVQRRRAPRPSEPLRFHLLAFAGLLAVFALPIALNLLMHWPGEFRKYLAYSASDRAGAGWTLAGGHRGLLYVLQFWARDASDRLVFIPAILWAATALVLTHPRVDTRRFLWACLGVVALESLLLLVAAMRGIDDLRLAYVAYFYWAAPLTVLIVLAAGAAARIERAGATGTARVAEALTVGLVLCCMRGSGLTNAYAGVPALPDVVTTLARERRSPDQPVVLDLEHDAWPDAVGVLMAAHRRGIDVCLGDAWWSFMVTRRFVCDRAQRASGRVMRFYLPGTAPDPPLARMARSEIARPAASTP